MHLDFACLRPSARRFATLLNHRVGLVLTMVYGSPVAAQLFALPIWSPPKSNHEVAGAVPAKPKITPQKSSTGHHPLALNTDDSDPSNFSRESSIESEASATAVPPDYPWMAHRASSRRPPSEHPSNPPCGNQLRRSACAVSKNKRPGTFSHSDGPSLPSCDH